MISPMQAYTESIVGKATQTACSLSLWQQEKAWKALAYAKRSPFYARRFEGVGMTNWADVPTMSAEDLSDPFSMLCVPARDVARIVTLSTSGTQKQKRLLFSEKDLESTVSFFAHGMSTMVRSGQHVAILMRGREPNTIGDLLTKGLSHIGVSADTFFPFDDDIAPLLQNADCIVGLPIPVLRLSRLHPYLRPETVLLSADYVPESVISGIANAWHCRVLTHYGSTETGYGYAVQCLSQKGYHMRDAEFLCEILDPTTHRPVPLGLWGEVTLTTLTERAMPLIRYRTGDSARLIPAPCACGSPLITLDKVMGRIGDAEPLIARLAETVFLVETVCDMRAKIKEERLHLLIDCLPGTQAETGQALREMIGVETEILFMRIPMSMQKRRME